MDLAGATLVGATSAQHALRAAAFAGTGGNLGAFRPAGTAPQAKRASGRSARLGSGSAWHDERENASWRKAKAEKSAAITATTRKSCRNTHAVDRPLVAYAPEWLYNPFNGKICHHAQSLREASRRSSSIHS